MKHGDFVWFEFVTTEPEKAGKFYSDVVGWDFESVPMDGGEPYPMLSAGGQGVAGIAPNPPSEEGQSCWMAYVACEDAELTASRATEMGGTVHSDINKVPGVGTFCVIEGPAGGVLAAFQAEDLGEMSEVDPMAPGHFSWHELYTDDREASVAFFSDLFGWVPTDSMEMESGEIYQMYGNGERTLGGIMGTTGMKENAPPHVWNHYIRVDDLERAEEQLTELGGQVTHGPMEVPGGDRIFVALDRWGAMISFIASGQRR